MATPSIALGTSEVTPLEMTAAFVPFSNGGRGVIPHVIDRIMTANGDTLYERSGSGPGQVIDPMYVGMMNAMLRETINSGTGRKAALPGWDAAGKTGTSQDFRDAWFIGYTRSLTAGVWFGNDNDKPTKKASGSNLPAIAWNRFMTDALAGVQTAELPGNYRYGEGSAVAALPTPPVSLGEDGRPLVLTHDDPIGDALAQAEDDGWLSDGTTPPADVGNAQPPKRRGFFQRLFGG